MLLTGERPATDSPVIEASVRNSGAAFPGAYYHGRGAALKPSYILICATFVCEFQT